MDLDGLVCLFNEIMLILDIISIYDIFLFLIHKK